MITTAVALLSIAQGPAIEWHNIGYSPDGSHILATKGKMATIWGSKTGKPLLNLEARESIDTAIFSRDGKSFYFGGRDRILRRADLPKFDPKAKEPVQLKFLYMETGAVGPERKSSVGNLASSSDGKKIAIAMSELILIVDPVTGETLQTIEKGDGYGSMHFANNDKELVTTPIISGIAIYDLTSTPPREILRTNTGARGSSGSLSPSGRYFVMGNQAGNSGVIDLQGKAMHHTVNLPKENWVDVHAWAKDEKTYFIGGNHGDVWVIDLASGKVVRSFKADGRVGGIAVHPDGKTIAVAAETVQQFDWTTGKLIKK